jgi:putative membrane protein
MRSPLRWSLTAGTVEDFLALLIRWLMLAFAIWLAAEVVQGIRLEGWRSSLVAAVFLGLLNTFIRPFITRNALPVTALTLGLFLVILNALLLIVAARLANPIEPITVDGFEAALFGAVIISLAGLFLRAVVDPEKIAGELMHFALPRRGQGL